ncbi:hypothetical protein [Streptomyces sp. NPDC059063]|uniref:hypothetical protein n=1 Tax=Streptomyces sp. NPDC059063 TaxID=3346712 RepID=UPI00367D3457
MTQATYVGTEDVPANQLKPFPGNAKRGDVPAILDSLRRNAQYRAVVARRLPGGDLVTLTGNHTVAAFTEHGPGDCHVTFKRGKETVLCGVCHNDPSWKPVVRTEIITCDDDTARRINLADNKTAELGGYDNRALNELLAALDGDLTGTAYTNDDVDELLKSSGALAESANAFLNDITPATPATHPFSDSAPPTRRVQPPQGPSSGPGEQAPPAAPPAHSDGVHTGPEPYTGPGAHAVIDSVHPEESIETFREHMTGYRMMAQTIFLADEQPPAHSCQLA